MGAKEQFRTVGNGLLVLAPAKINLSLLIAGERDDGFHEIETIIAKVNLFDEVLIERRGRAGVELICKGPHWAPGGRENLVYKASELFLPRYDLQGGLKITLTKNIPAGSGLGSASSDAAATLMGVNRLLELGIGREQLSEMGTQLGSDVPFFLNGPLAFCTGKGEEIEELGEKFDFLALLVLPDVNVSTREVYANYKHEFGVYENLRRSINGYVKKNRIDLVAKMCANMLERSCFSLYEGLAKLKGRIESLGVGPMCLSGSGSAMFCLVGDRDVEKARAYEAKLKERIGCNTVIVNNNRW